MIQRLVGGLAGLIAVATIICAATPILHAQGTPSFTDDELKYIASLDEPVSIGFVQDRIPISFADENGDLAGVSRYIFDRVSQLTGLDFIYLPLPSGEVTYDTLIDGGYDLVSSVEYNSENQHARGILMSDPYLSSRKVVVARKGLDFSFDAPLTIAISTGSQTIRNVLKESYPSFEPVDYPSTVACFDAVNSGEADLLMQNQYIIEHWISKPIYEKLSVIPVLGLDDKLCFSAVVAFGGGEGPSEESGRMLIGILNKAIACMSEDEISSYTIRAITENKYVYNFSDVLYRYRAAFAVFIISAAVIFILTALIARLHIKITESRLDASVRARFLSTMSHELKTPLNGIIGLNYLMSSKLDDKEKLKGYLRQSDSTAKYLLTLVNDMLDMSGLQSDKLELESKPVDLRLIIDTAVSIAKSAAKAKGLRFSSDVKIDWPCVVSDGVRIQQILLHLLDNARKFTSKGGTITLTVSQKLSDSKVTTTAVVSDTGRGMSEEFQKHIFDTFAQERESVSKGNQGAGLGLSISSRLAKMMNGGLSFVSKKDVGSSFTFYFTSALGELDENERFSAESQNEQNPRILVAEDNELNGEIILEMLRENGYEADLAENGAIALDMFCRSEPCYYGVILMDLLMPEMDGFEASRAIRALSRADAGSVRIFACTANSSGEDREKALASGMNDFITKPVDVGLLLKKIRAKNDTQHKA